MIVINQLWQANYLCLSDMEISKFYVLFFYISGIENECSLYSTECFPLGVVFWRLRYVLNPYSHCGSPQIFTCMINSGSIKYFSFSRISYKFFPTFFQFSNLCWRILAKRTAILPAGKIVIIFKFECKFIQVFVKMKRSIFSSMFKL